MAPTQLLYEVADLSARKDCMRALHARANMGSSVALLLLRYGAQARRKNDQPQLCAWRSVTQTVCHCMVWAWCEIWSALIAPCEGYKLADTLDLGSKRPVFDECSVGVI